MNIKILKISDNSVVAQFDGASDIGNGLLDDSMMITTEYKNYVIRMKDDEYLEIEK